jgi:hypothetical protein
MKRNTRSLPSRISGFRHWNATMSTNARKLARRVRHPIVSATATMHAKAHTKATCHHSPTRLSGESRSGKNATNCRLGKMPSSVKNAVKFG